MTREIRKHVLAESDLIGIKELADNPEMGAKHDYVREGYRVLFINSHAVYYTVARSAI